MMLPPISQSFSWLSWYRGVLDVADRLVRFPAGPRVRLKTADAPKGNGLAQKKRCLPIGPTNCFHCASKLLRGTFWAGLRTLKTVAAALEGLSTAQLSAAALEASRWLCNGASLLAPQSVSIGLRNCGVARFRQALKFSKPSQQLSKASAPQNPPQQLSKRPALPWCLPLGPRSCFYWASKLPCGMFWAGLKILTQQLSKASALRSFRSVPLALPWCLPWPFSL